MMNESDKTIAGFEPRISSSSTDPPPEEQLRELRRLRSLLWNSLLSHQAVVQDVIVAVEPLERRDRDLPGYRQRWQSSMQWAAEGRPGGRHSLLARRRALAERIVAIDACTEVGAKGVALTRERLEGSEQLSDAAHLHIVEFVWGELVTLRNAMIERHMGLVRLAIRRARVPSDLRDELAHEAVFALIRAMECFDPGAGTRFSTYAMYWLRSAVHRGDVRMRRSVRLPYHLVSKGRQYEAQLAKAPDADRNVVAHDVGLGDRQHALVAASRSSLVVPFEEHSQPIEFVAEHFVDHRRALGQLPGALARLRSRDRWVLEQRFDLDGGDRRSLQCIADELGLSRERVRQIQLRAQRELRRGLEARRPRSVNESVA